MKFRILFFGFIIIAFLICVHKAKASDETYGSDYPPYVQFSGGSTIRRGEAPVMDFTLTYPSPLPMLYWQGSVTQIGVNRYEGTYYTDNFVVRGLFVGDFRYFDMRLGVAWVENPRPYNGSNADFNIQLDHKFIKLPITLTYSHISNAGIKLPNLGRDMIMIGWRF